MIQAEKQKINTKDFVIKILGKSYMSYRYAIKDEKGKKRIYIGRNNNASLPGIYVEENQQELKKMIFTNIMKVSYRRNIPINEIAKKT